MIWQFRYEIFFLAAAQNEHKLTPQHRIALKLYNFQFQEPCNLFLPSFPLPALIPFPVQLH